MNDFYSSGESPPYFSVVIVTRNRSDMVSHAVSHVLQQGFDKKLFELIVVNNGSTDQTPEVLAGLQHSASGRLRVVNEDRAGIGYARNAGWRSAQGEWVLFLDDDALAPHDLLANYRTNIDCYPDAVAWGGGAVLRYPARLPICWGPGFDGMLSALDLGDEPRVLFFPAAPYGLNMLIRTATLKKMGGFRDEITFGGDETDLFLRMDMAGQRVRYAPSCVVVHAVSLNRFSLRWLLSAAFRSGGYHANLDRLNGGLQVGWRMVSAGWLKVLIGRRGCIPVALSMHVLRVSGYMVARFRARHDDG